jgi:hypothetical protein
VGEREIGEEEEGAGERKKINQRRRVWRGEGEERENIFFF